MLSLIKDERKALLLIVLIGIALRLSIVMLAPVWSGPDEPSHYTYIQHIAEKGEIPYAPEEGDAGLLNVTGQNPPLFHIIGAVFYIINGGVQWLRLESLLFGVACILLTFLIASELSKNRLVRLGSAAFIALLPTHIVLSSTINNETALYTFVLLSILFMLKAVKSSYTGKHVLLSGLFFGLAFATRFNAAILGLPWLVVLFHYFTNNFSLKKVLAILPAGFIAFIVLFGNYLAYGKLFPFRELHPSTLDLGIVTYFIPRVFAGYWLQEYAIATIPDFKFTIFLLLGLVLLAAVISIARDLRKVLGWASEKQTMLLILTLTVVANICLFIFQNIFYYEPDARLLYPTVSIIGIGIIYGLSKLQGRKGMLAVFALFVLMALLDLLLIINYNTTLPSVPWPLP